MTEPQFRFLTEHDLQRLPEPEWLVHGLVPKDGLTVLYGPPGCGKSFVALSLAVSIARNLDWLGRKVRPGPVIYIAAEGLSGFARRLAALKQWHGLKSVKKLIIVPDVVYLHHEDTISAYLDQLQEQVPASICLTIVDTLSRCSAGSNESSNADRELTVEGLNSIRRATEGSILAVHHTGWNEDRMRGGSSLQAAADSVLALKKTEHMLELKVEKQRDGEDGEVTHLALTRCAESLVITTGAKVPRGLSHNQQHALQILSEIATGKGVRVSTWRRHTGMAESSFFDAQKRLVANDYVRRDQGLYSLAPAGVDLLQLQINSKSLQGEVPSTPLQPPSSRGAGDGVGRFNFNETDGIFEITMPLNCRRPRKDEN